MALGSLLALGALAVLAIGGAALLLRKRPEPAPGSDAWFAQMGSIPFIGEANRRAWEESKTKNLTGGKFGDVVGYFVPESGPATVSRDPSVPLNRNPDQKPIQVDRAPFDGAGRSEPQTPPTPVYMTPDGLISSLASPGSVQSRGDR